VSTKPLDLETQLIERIVKQRNERVTKAEERAKEILKSAQEEVERIKDESEKQILSLVGSDLRASRDRILGRAELEGRRSMMNARQRVLSHVFDEISKRLKDISDGKDKKVDYSEILVNLITEAAMAIGDEELIVSANESDLKYLGKNLGNINTQLKATLGECTVKLADESIDVIGGVIVRNRDGTKTYYNTLDGRLESVKNKFAAQVAEILGVI
jgi:vacuolar-type H+-ATPase subunit E/Vma4